MSNPKNTPAKPLGARMAGQPAQPGPTVTKGDSPLTVGQVAARVQAQNKREKGDDLTPEDIAALGEQPETPEEQEPDEGDENFVAAETATDGPPPWAVVPSDLVLPKGKQIYFIRILAAWTDRPKEGDRHCIAWNLTVADEGVAMKRCRGEATRVTRESTLAMIRAIDGHKVDWTNSNMNSAGNVRKWFDLIGPRGRVLMQNVYLRTHSIDNDTVTRFFDDCFTSMSSV